jgi:hypothetical protein
VAVDRERFEDSNVVTLEDLVAAHDLHWQSVVHAGNNLKMNYNMKVYYRGLVVLVDFEIIPIEVVRGQIFWGRVRVGAGEGEAPFSGSLKFEQNVTMKHCFY